MTERTDWLSLRARLGSLGRLVRVENAAGAGTPDVCYCFRGVTGWLELKHALAWPRRLTTPLRVPSLTLEQVRWLIDWRAAGGIAWLWLRVERDEFLMTPTAALELYEGSVITSQLAVLKLGAIGYIARRPASDAQLVSWLMSRE